MSDKRKRTPPKEEADILDSCRRRCCVCVALNDDAAEKRGQIAHLDHNRANRNSSATLFL